MDWSWNTALSDALNNSTFWQYMQGIGDTLWRFADKTVGNFNNVMWNIGDFFINIVWKPILFIWDLIVYLLYAIKSIIVLVWNLLYSILNGFIEMFVWLWQTFHDLSYFMGVKTSMLISMFILVLIIIWFQFLLRLFLWKFHYKKVSKS